MIALSWATSSACAIWRAIDSASSMDCALRDALGQRRTLDQLHHQRTGAFAFFKPVNRRDVRMIERREDLRLAAETGEPVGVARHHWQQHLDRDIAIERRVASAIHLAHSAGAQGEADLVRSEAVASCERHP
jgi:hypothetical protein